MPRKKSVRADEVREEVEENDSPNLAEKGVVGLNGFTGLIQEAYASELRWPTVQPMYSRLRRSDPEIGTVLNFFISLSRHGKLTWQLPEKPSDAEKKFAEFGEQVLEDIEGGISSFLEQVVSQVPFFGWSSWNVVNCYRQKDWVPPGDSETEWRSKFDDSLIGIRKLAFRDTSSFERWEVKPENQTYVGWWQTPKNAIRPSTLLYFKDLLHLRFGDPHNPEGLSPLEKVWRLERIKYGLELVQGIGFEHSAGYFQVTAQKKLTSADHALIRRAAKAVQTAVQGNYVALPQNLTGEVKDVTFSAAATILEAVKYYGILKLMTYMMQWVSMSTVSGVGSFSAIQDGSSLAVEVFNSMMGGFADQMDYQVGTRLLRWNADTFNAVERRPKLTYVPAPVKVKLTELGTFMSSLEKWMPLGSDDVIAVRRQSGFLPEQAPAEDDVINPKQEGPVDADGNPINPDGSPREELPNGNDQEPKPADKEKAEANAMAMQRGVDAYLGRSR